MKLYTPRACGNIRDFGNWFWELITDNIIGEACTTTKAKIDLNSTIGKSTPIYYEFWMNLIF